MHMVLGAFVRADGDKEALERGRMVFDQLIDRYWFDYITDFGDRSTSMSGLARYGDWMEEEFGETFTATPAASQLGEAFIEHRWESTERFFERNARTISFLVENCTTQEIADQDIPPEVIARSENDDELNTVRYSRHLFNDLGGGDGAEMYLYDPDGWGIITADRLNDYCTDEYWIVPGDAHY